MKAMKEKFIHFVRMLDVAHSPLRDRMTLVLEWLIIFLAALAYAGGLLDMNPAILQQSGEHNESATRPVVAEIGLNRYGEIPLWNPYMQTGLPMAGDPVNHFWAPVSTLPIWLMGGISGMKVSVFLSYLLAGYGLWYLARVCGLRGLFRVWSSLLFMFSGGLALLWRLGWYELLLGAVWFPWAFASFWQALHKTSRRSLAWAAICSAMVLLPGGGYYPFYLAGSALVILLVALILVKTDRGRMIKRAVAVAILTVGLVAVMLVPIIDGYRLIVREAGSDMNQSGSQPMMYALLNYVISDPEWFSSNALGTQGGWNWFYLGPLSLVFLVCAPLIYRRNRAILIAMTLLFIFLLAWHANRSSPIKYLYDALPFLYQLRFPNRLLYIAAIPLIILSGAGFQAIFLVTRRKLAAFRFDLHTPDGRNYLQIKLRSLVTLAAFAIALLSVQDVYAINQGVAFAPEPLDSKSYRTLRWLKTYDPETYYTNLGPGIMWWTWWTPAAFNLEMPVFNFYYNQHLTTRDAQQAPESPFMATPKYQLWQTQDGTPEGGELVLSSEGIQVWRMPAALPFAFTASDTLISSSAKLSNDLITAAQAHYDGPNRVVAMVNSPGTQAETLVVLVSDYPGWRLQIDGQLAPLTPVNAYLGAQVLPGEHTYTFEFDPPLYRVGALITIITLIVIVIMLRPDPRKPVPVTVEQRDDSDAPK
jgi:hypothetical protein